MFFPTSYDTAAGWNFAFRPAPLVIPRDPAAALLFAAHMDRRADAALVENRPDAADRFAHAAYEARRRAEAVRP